MAQSFLRQYQPFSYTIRAKFHHKIAGLGAVPIHNNHGLYMHIFLAIVLILGAITALLSGFMSVLYDLLERGPHDAPLIPDVPLTQRDDVGWPPRFPGGGRSREPAASDLQMAGKSSRGPTAWPAEGENSRM
jgi:hypothetical protein